MQQQGYQPTRQTRQRANKVTSQQDSQPKRQPPSKTTSQLENNQQGKQLTTQQLTSNSINSKSLENCFKHFELRQTVHVRRLRYFFPDFVVSGKGNTNEMLHDH